jgi:hypothetical protein
MTVPEADPKIGVEAILKLTGTDREAKAYAFLYAAFKRTEISANPVRDALDCLTPFIAPYLNTIAGKQALVEGIKQDLRASFGFDIPLYAIEQLMPALEKAGYVEYKKNVRSYFAKRQENHFDVAKSEIETDFDEVATALAAYAKAKGFTSVPSSGSWGEALIAFLKTRTERAHVSVVSVKGAILDTGKVENAIVGVFIKNLFDRNQALFAKLLNIFMGVLVEEFISSVSEIGGFDLERPVHVLYDTAVLLRLLGCSGTLLRTATEELTRYLQDLGFQIYYFSGNEAEVSGIFDTLVYVKDTGRELEGETAEAISNGEVTITQLRMLQNAFPEKLAALNVFPADRLERSAVDNAKYQIDERGFTEYLKQKSLANRRTYSQQNRENDAGYLGSIIRLRRRLNTRDLAGCGYVFVTSNKFLAQVSRRYLIEQGVIRPQHFPPILSVGQIATIAWLLRDKTLEPAKAGRELLSNCFAAIRPDQEWFRYFREGVENVAGSIEEYGKDSRNALTLQAARRIAQEESFGNSAVVRELNMAEILSRAEQENKRILDEKDGQIAAEREAAALGFERHRREVEEARAREAKNVAADKDAAVRQAAADAARETEMRLQEDRRKSAYRKADMVLVALKAIAVVLFILAGGMSLYLQSSGQPSTTLWVLSAILLVVNVLDVMDLLRINIAERVFSKLREWIASALVV